MRTCASSSPGWKVRMVMGRPPRRWVGREIIADRQRKNRQVQQFAGPAVAAHAAFTVAKSACAIRQHQPEAPARPSLALFEVALLLYPWSRQTPAGLSGR